MVEGKNSLTFSALSDMPHIVPEAGPRSRRQDRVSGDCWWYGDFATAMAGPRPCTARQASFALADNSIRTVYSPK